MSFMDKLKSMFGGSSDAADAHAGHDHSAPEPPAAPADPAGMSTSEPQPSEPQPAAEEDDRLA
jgi:hypothetical protein